MSKKHIILFIFGLAVLLFFIQLIACNHNPIDTNYLPKKNSTCISCHSSMEGLAPAHSSDKISCTSCHMGDNTANDKQIAHQEMFVVPGNLSNVSQTCAHCHPGIDIRVKNSMMNTMSGIISVDKFVFGENTNLDSLFNIHHLSDLSPGDKHLRNKCGSCHIGNEKENPHPITEMSRGGGCNACHLNYSSDAIKAHTTYIESNKETLTKLHPSLSLNVTDNHCFGCHSRSGRISTNYEGWHETTIKTEGTINTTTHRRLEDGRIFEKQEADVHHLLGLSCIDCHDAEDVMGNGNTYAHQEEAVHVKCEDCHQSNPSKSIYYKDLRESDRRIIRLRNIDTSSQFLLAPHTNRPLLNVIKENDQWLLLSKVNNNKLALSSPSDQCAKEVHKNINCSTCHTSWAPQCISCHTSLDMEEEGYDFLSKDWIEGNWMEKGDLYHAEFPALGVIEKNGNREIRTFAPGMIMSLEHHDSASFHRLYAPVSAHTISDKANDCKTCHNNPVAYGYGRGELVYSIDGVWQFYPQYERLSDGLPKDAWIPFLKESHSQNTTRSNARAFTVDEQHQMLRVGACLSCHQNNKSIINSILSNFEETILNRSEKCILPKF